jgi:hypothetical protein
MDLRCELAIRSELVLFECRFLPTSLAGPHARFQPERSADASIDIPVAERLLQRREGWPPQKVEAGAAVGPPFNVAPWRLT